MDGRRRGCQVSTVHLAAGNVRGSARLQLDGQATDAINSRLMPKPERPDPTELPRNSSSAFVGTYVLGMGFTMTPQERAELVKRNQLNAERIFPYLGGEEVNTSPTQTHDRYVISFGQMEIDEAERRPDLVRIVREKVQPERERLRGNADGRRRKQYWWQFGRWTPALYAAISPLQRCLVTARVSKYLMFHFQLVGAIPGWFV